MINTNRDNIPPKPYDKRAWAGIVEEQNIIDMFDEAEQRDTRFSRKWDRINKIFFEKRCFCQQ